MTDRNRTQRTLLIPDHVWLAYEQMAADMGSERDGLVSQALFAFARMNGYLVPSDLQRLGLSSPPPTMESRPERTAHGERSDAASRAPTGPARPAPRAAPAAAVDSNASTLLLDEPPARRAPANPERMAELERQLQAAPTPAPAARAAPAPRGGSIEVDDALLGDDGVQATAMELPALHDLDVSSERRDAPERSISDGGDISGRVLVISSDGRELDRVIKERFLIGRGKHCDLIINSGKVSREHAAITREGGDYFIEDLGSSNGTWFDKRRITKRQIQEGDDYFICAEKLSCSFSSHT